MHILDSWLLSDVFFKCLPIYGLFSHFLHVAFQREKKISVISFMNFEFDVESQVIVKLISSMLTILNVSIHKH